MGDLSDISAKTATLALRYIPCDLLLWKSIQFEN